MPDRLFKIHGIWKSESAKDGYVCDKDDSRLLVALNIGPLYMSPGCLLPRVESSRRVTLLQSNVYKRLHENSSQTGSAPLAG